MIAALNEGGVRLTCAHCGKRLSRKTARQIDGVVMCGTCMFGPPKRRDRDEHPEGEDAKRLSGEAMPARADRHRPEHSDTNQGKR